VTLTPLIPEKGLQHVLERHFVGGVRTAGKSLFGRGEKIEVLVKAASSVQPVAQTGGNFARVVDAGRQIGTDRVTGAATSTYTVITNSAGELVTAFPGTP
jgi:hypothetical protein